MSNIEDYIDESKMHLIEVKCIKLTGDERYAIFLHFVLKIPLNYAHFSACFPQNPLELCSLFCISSSNSP